MAHRDARWNRPWIGAIFVALALTLSGTLGFAQQRVSGAVRFTGDFETLSTAAADHHYTLRVSPWAERQRPPLDQLRVALIAQEAPAPGPARTIELDAFEANPRSIVVAPGTPIVFASKGPRPWAVDALGRPSIEPVALEPGASSREIVLKQPGLYIFEDRNYTSVRAYVIVASSVADSALAAVGDNKATFELPLVPAGSYSLLVFFQGRRIFQREVTLKADSDEKLEFLLDVGDFNKGR